MPAAERAQLVYTQALIWMETCCREQTKCKLVRCIIGGHGSHENSRIQSLQMALVRFYSLERLTFGFLVVHYCVMCPTYCRKEEAHTRGGVVSAIVQGFAFFRSGICSINAVLYVNLSPNFKSNSGYSMSEKKCMRYHKCSFDCAIFCNLWCVILSMSSWWQNAFLKEPGQHRF